MLTLPTDPQIFLTWGWNELEPFAQDLLRREITAETVEEWLSDWSRLSEVVDEMYTRLYLATAQDTTDETAKARFHRFLEEVFPRLQNSF